MKNLRYLLAAMVSVFSLSCGGAGSPALRALASDTKRVGAPELQAPLTGGLARVRSSDEMSAALLPRLGPPAGDGAGIRSVSASAVELSR